MRHILLTFAAALSTTLAMGAKLPSATKELPVSEPRVTIPTPPLGQRWVLNDTFSDEFNGTTLNEDKWFDNHPTWRGRAPGLFLSENVKVADGYLQLSGSVMAEPKSIKESTFDIGCAAVVSKSEEAHFGYYESRVKANKTSLSTTFWLSRGGTHTVVGNQPEWLQDSEGNGTFGQELDICETIGRNGTEADGWKAASNAFCTSMNSNVHCWYKEPKSGKKEDIVIKKIPSLKPQSGEILSDDFNVYGCWWRDKESAEFYLNNISGGEQKFVTKSGQPFYIPKQMGLNMVVETYSWIPRPEDSDLLDSDKNTSYYDWVRHYVLIAADRRQRGVDIAPEQRYVFEDYAMILREGGIQQSGNELRVTLLYSAPKDRALTLIVLDEKGKKSLSALELDAYAGYAQASYTLKKVSLKSGARYTVAAYLDLDGQRYAAGDSLHFTAE